MYTDLEKFTLELLSRAIFKCENHIVSTYDLMHFITYKWGGIHVGDKDECMKKFADDIANAKNDFVCDVDANEKDDNYFDVFVWWVAIDMLGESETLSSFGMEKSIAFTKELCETISNEYKALAK